MSIGCELEKFPLVFRNCISICEASSFHIADRAKFFTDSTMMSRKCYETSKTICIDFVVGRKCHMQYFLSLIRAFL